MYKGGIRSRVVRRSVWPWLLAVFLMAAGCGDENTETTDDPDGTGQRVITGDEASDSEENAFSTSEGEGSNTTSSSNSSDLTSTASIPSQTSSSSESSKTTNTSDRDSTTTDKSQPVTYEQSGPQAQFIRFESWSVPWTPANFPRTIGARTNSGLPIEYSIVASSEAVDCSISNGQLVVRPDTLPSWCDVKAEQPGNDDWLAAEPVTRRLTVERGGSKVVVVSGPTKNADGSWRVTARDVNDVADDATTTDNTPGICSSDVNLWTITITVRATGECSVEIRGDGELVYDGTGETVRFHVAVPTTTTMEPATTTEWTTSNESTTDT